MHMKYHLMNGQFHIIFNFKGGEQKIVAIVRQIIGRAPEVLFEKDCFICDLTDMDGNGFLFFKFKTFKIHNLPFVTKDMIDDKIAQFFTFIIA